MTYKKVTYIFKISFNESFEEPRVKQFIIDVMKTIRMFMDFRGIFFRVTLEREVEEYDPKDYEKESNIKS